MLNSYTMKVRLFATLRQVAGTKEVEVDLEAGATVRHALERLVDLYPNLKEEIFTERGELQSSVIILLKGRNIGLEEGLDTVLGKDDYLAIFPPVAGGEVGYFKAPSTKAKLLLRLRLTLPGHQAPRAKGLISRMTGPL